jgi:hypothetical protein
VSRGIILQKLYILLILYKVAEISFAKMEVEMLEDGVEYEEQIKPELIKYIRICSRCQGAGSRGMDKCNYCD